VLDDKSKEYGKAGQGLFDFKALYKQQAAQCYKNVALQDVQPTVWTQACNDMRASYGQVLAGETLRLAKTISDLTKAGCVKSSKEVSSQLRLECSAYAAYSMCLEKFHPNGEKYCRQPPLKMSDTQAALQSMTVKTGDVQIAAQGTPTDSAIAKYGIQKTAPVVNTTPPRLVPPREVTSTQSQQTVRDTEAAVKVIRAQSRPLWTSIEAETLISSGKFQLQGGQVVVQEMTGFGPGWSGNAQAFWHGGSAGAVLDLFIEVPKDGAWVVEVDFTRAPDYGQLAFQVDRHVANESFDGYAQQVVGPVTFSPGTFALIQGTCAVSFKIIGRNAASSGWLAGIDRIRLKPAAEP
jgi:hypothetical protein